MLDDSVPPTLAPANRPPPFASHKAAVSNERPSLIALFERAAAARPDCAAVLHGAEALTFGELDRRANRLAHALISAGVGPERLVGICLERSPDWVVSVLGIWKAGGAFVPLDASSPPARQQEIIEAAGLQVVIGTETAGGLARSISPEETRAEARWPATAPKPQGGPSTLAYLLYTSGSTGTPKGVEIPHSAVANLNSALAKALPIYGRGGPLRVSVNGPLYFDTSIKQLIQISNGHCLCIIPESIRRDAEALLHHLVEQQVEVLDCTPSQLRNLVDVGMLETRGALHTVLVGGEPIPPALWAAIGSSRIAFYNLYGPTECTVDATAARAVGDAVVVGRALQNMTIHVLDDRLQPVAVGEVGEVFIGGAGVGRGYFRRPVETADRFLPDPFSQNAGARMYRTGDLGNLDAEGVLHLLGRVDHQVKIRGHRVELAEIEAALERLEGVRSAAVIDVENAALHERQLRAFVVGAPGQTLDGEALRRGLAERLPGYLVPERIMAIDGLPLTPRGKVDRAALRSLSVAPAPQRPVEFASDAERTVAAVFEELLGRTGIGPTDDFFSVGGSSLAVMRLRARIRARLGVDLPVARVMADATVRALAQEADRARTTQLVRGRPAKTVAPGEWAPVSFAQERMLNTPLIRRPCNSIVVAMDATGPLDVDKLERAFQAVLARHEVLRSTFEQRDGEWRQRVTFPADQRLERIRIGGPPEERELRLEELTSEIANRGFDLQAEPPCRGYVLQAETGHRVILTMNHLVFDGLSLGLLADELGAAYRNGALSDRRPLQFQYADFSAWQRSEVDPRRLSELAAAWERKLTALPPPLRLRRRIDLTCAYDAAAYSLAIIPAELSSRIEGFAAAEKTTVFSCLVAAYTIALGSLAQREDVVVGTVLADRTVPETERMIGLFANWTFFRTSLGANPSFLDVVRRVDREVRDTYELTAYPYSELEKAVAARGPALPITIYNAAINYRPYRRGAFSVEGLTLQPVAFPTGSTRNDFILDLDDFGGGLRATLVYRRAICDEEESSRLLTAFSAALEQLWSAEPISTLVAS